MQSTINQIKPLDFEYLCKRWPIVGRQMWPNYQPDFVATPVVYFFSNRWKKHFPELEMNPNQGLALVGPKGIGKSISFKILRKIVHTNPNINRKIREEDAKGIEVQYKLACEQKQGAAWLRDLIETPELIINDIGKEDPAFNDFGTVRNLIADILWMRYDLWQNGKIRTYISTNFTWVEMEKWYANNPYLVDRMKEMFIMKVLDGESKRTNPPPMPANYKTPELTKEHTLSEYDKRMIYLQGFQRQINDPGPVIFYDKGYMWNFLSQNGYIDPKKAITNDVYNAAVIIAREEKAKILASLTVNERMNYKPLHSEEEESMKQAKHLVITSFFKDNTIDFQSLPQEQILK